MIKINEVQLADYVHCPILYDALHVKKLPFEKSQSMQKMLTSVTLSFFLALMDGRVLRMSDLKKKWDAVCEKADYMTPQKNLEGIAMLTKMYAWAEREQIRIRDTKTPYSFVIKKNGHRCEYVGELTTLALTKTGQTELLHVDFSNKYPDQAILDMNLKYSADAYIFKKNFDTDIGIHIHNVKNDKDFFTFRSEDDFVRMLDSIDSISRSIEQKIIYPRENIMCGSCGLKNFCRKWSL